MKKRGNDGKLLIVPPTLVGNLDALAAIRGAANLFVDMMEEPEKIKRALEAVCRAHSEMINAYAELEKLEKVRSDET